MLNPIQIVFLSLSVFYSFIVFLVYNYEKCVPAYVLRTVKYGAFCYKGNDARYMKKLEVPKYFCRHYYVFTFLLDVINLVYMLLVYLCGIQVNIYYAKFLQALLGNTSPVSVLASMTGMCLLTLQCTKRFYEVFRMQVFASSGNIYVTHYVAGWLFHLARNAAIIGQAPLFFGDKDRNNIVWADLRTTLALVPGIPMFFWAWYEQHQTNLILANLRKDKKTGQVITEEHKIPHGRLFRSISSPHRYCEIILYATLWCILQTKTFFCIFVWVLCNQIQTSMMVHKWYKNTFTAYPKERFALFNSIL